MISTFAKRLYETRTLANMTQQELGDKCGVSKATISRYEKMQRLPSIEMLGLLCQALDVPSKHLLGW